MQLRRAGYIRLKNDCRLSKRLLFDELTIGKQSALVDHSEI